MNRFFINLLSSLFLVTLVSCATTGAKPDPAEIAGESPAVESPGPAATPAAAATPDAEPRKQFKGVTNFAVSPEATRDPSFKTPIADELLGIAAHLPAGIAPRLPFDGSFKVTTGYGFESRAWTHQTIGNENSANDFFALDFGTPVGTPTLAVARGRILTAQDRASVDSYGLYVVIDHGRGARSIYAHLSELEYRIEQGEPEVWVEAGQRIGLSGTSGTRWPHLHFAMHKDSRISHSGCDVGGRAMLPEPLGGYFGIRSGHVLEATTDGR